MLDYLMLELTVYANTFIFLQDGMTFHVQWNVQKFLNTTLPNRLIGETGATDEDRTNWPPCSPYLTPCDFVLWRYVKEEVFVLPLKLDTDELKSRIKADIEIIDRNVRKSMG
jgi:hypothetical protein